MAPVSNQVEPQQVHGKALDNHGIDDKKTTTTPPPLAQKLSKGFGLIRQVSSVAVIGSLFLKDMACTYLPSPLVCTRTHGYCHGCNRVTTSLQGFGKGKKRRGGEQSVISITESWIF